MQDLSLHILDIAQNSVRAEAKNISIEITEDEEKDMLILSMQDDGKGMDRDTLNKAGDPFFTTKDAKKFGLGLSLLGQAAKEAGGGLKISSEKGKGTKVYVTFRLSHPDAKPKGDILGTLANLVAAYPSIRFIYDYKKGKEVYHFDTQTRG